LTRFRAAARQCGFSAGCSSLDTRVAYGLWVAQLA